MDLKTTFMKHSNISVGLDIGTTKIVAMVGDKNEFGKVEILGLENPKALEFIEEWLITSPKPFNPFSRL